MNTIVMLLSSALLASAATLGAAYFAYRQWGERRLRGELSLMQDEFERRVKSGVLAAGRELLPELRREVAAGFRDALRESHAAGLAEDAAKVVSGAAGLLESRLGDLFGLRPKK